MYDESRRLYKLMVMYMLDRVDFPLSNTQISDFMLEKQYTNYFTFQEIIHSLEDDGFIDSVSYHNSTKYQLTSNGEETIKIFSGKISATIRTEIDEYLVDNKYELKCDAQVLSDYTPGKEGNYTVRLTVKENNTNIIDLYLSVPTENEAKSICSKWKQKNQVVYEQIMQNLM